MQPPPALTSMDALKEMLQRADEEGRQAELCATQKMGCSASDGNLWTSGEEREKQREGLRGAEKSAKEPETEVEVRGRADGGRTLESRTAPVHSVSFAASTQSDCSSWMGEDVKIPVRGFGLPSVLLQEKKALVSAVSVAVEAILAQFSSSRTVVQKALSGDSSVNPTLGRLVLQCLCPALHGLLSDGLKPHQCDVIAGRRPNSAWGLVQASTKPGLNTQTMFNLQVRVGELPQLKQSKQRFNAFLFGLLNTKLLDFWLSHLQSCNDVLETFYQPSSFMRLSSMAGQTLYEELLLLLQPLSLLTFNLDLLFQHHHLEPANHSPQLSSLPAQDAGGFRLSPQGILSKGDRASSSSSSSNHLESLSKLDLGGSEHKEATSETSSSSVASSDDQGSGMPPHREAPPLKNPVSVKRTSPQLLWVQEKEIRDLPPPAIDDGSLTQQAGQVIQDSWEAVMRLGGRLSRNLSEMSLPVGQIQGKEGTELYSQTGSDFPRVDSTNNVPWGLGRLFGATKGARSPVGPPTHTRRPSQWLGPGVTALTRMVSSSSLPTLKRAPEPQTEREPEKAKEVETQNIMEKPRPLRSVRTLCDHSGTGSELSFQKGEELVVLEGVDQDWIRCRQGEQEGLVPIGYTSLIM
ncbi:RUN and SH3 domain-containing protein 1 isoform X2 [Gadus morhua]|uniref:RUN and SH3 domain containing 1 n=1 Tax=Gadus morhua TaxID=8049 RepID=A0A8C5FJB5_GADMO|nr:RUN and SH3 domain-containing protein 1 isoform X2 [Gadus morhua]